MKIQDLTVFSYQAHYNHGTYSMSNGRTSGGHPSIVIRIRTDSGIEGWAENAPLGSNYLPSTFTGELAALKEVGPLIIGLDPQSPAATSAQLNQAIMSGMAAKSIIDMACWDILGKSGVVAMQLKISDDPLVDARRIRAIREAVPESVYLFADANANWTVAQALIYSRALGQDVTVTLEQPCRTISECAQVVRLTGLPVIVDEPIYTVANLVDAHAAGITGVNIKLSRVGGITKARIMRDTAEALGMTVNIDDTWGCALTTAQNLQIACSTSPNRLGACDCYVEWTNPMIADVPRMQPDGRVPLPSLPGNGFGAVNVEMLGEPLFQIT